MISASVLVVDDDDSIRETLVEFLSMRGCVVQAAASAATTHAALARHSPDVVIMDLRLPDVTGLELLTQLRTDDAEMAIIVLTGYADIGTAVKAMQLGALDLMEKPVDLERLQEAVQRGVESVRLKREVVMRRALDMRVHDVSGARSSHQHTSTPPLSTLIDLAARNDDAPILILGETGTGKGFVARQIHDRSPRAKDPFVEINCASLSATFFESELFGHERGAFTDARQAKRGLLEVAAGGSIFLDEIGELALDVQPRLLKVIEEHRFRRLGGTTELHCSARPICATNHALQSLVETRQFRADLFYRLQVLTISIAPLRERLDELPELIAQFLPRGARLTSDALSAMRLHTWPGNLRELRHTLWRASIVAEDREITAATLGLPATTLLADDADDLSMKSAEQRAIARALAVTGGNRVRAAQLLGIARSTLHEKLREPPALPNKER
jgi:DNA-binding NtrC family response regulator